MAFAHTLVSLYFSMIPPPTIFSVFLIYDITDLVDYLYDKNLNCILRHPSTESIILLDTSIMKAYNNICNVYSNVFTFNMPIYIVKYSIGS